MKKYLLILVSAIFCLSSCNKPVDPKISVVDPSFAVGYEGGEFATVVNCNTEWQVTWNEDGVSVTPTKGVDGDSVRVVIPPTKEITTQQIVLTFYATDAEGGSIHYAYCRATQAAYPFISCSDADQEISAEGGKVYFHVNSSRPWVAVFPDGNPAGCELDPVEWTENSVEVYMTVPASDSPAERVISVTLKLKDFPEVSTVLTVKQAPKAL